MRLVLRWLLSVLVWVSAAVYASVVTMLYLIAWAAASYGVEGWLAGLMSRSIASIVLDALTYGSILLIWAVAGFAGSHLSVRLGLWSVRSADGYWWAMLAAVLIAAGFVAIESAPLAAAGMLAGAAFGRKSGKRALSRDDSIRDAVAGEFG